MMVLHLFLLIHRHVQVNNESAIEFYKKFGFEIVETKEQYYKRIEPAGAHVLEKNLRTSPIHQNSTESGTTTTAQQNGIDNSHHSNSNQPSKSKAA